MQVLVADPAVFETPLPLLADSRVTPIERLFIRNNQTLDGSNTLAAMPLEGWTIQLDGLIRPRKSFDAALLAELPQVEYEMVLQCSGNGRSLFSLASPTNGTQWGRGGMGNVRLAGPRLATVLDRLEVDVDPKARFLTAEGRDRALPDKEDFEHSMPLDDVLQHAILATHLNGQPLPAVHGGPVRLVTPGVYATMHIKWIERLRFDAEETHNYNQIPRYRVPLVPIAPGEAIEYTFDNSRFNWRMNVKSVILRPTPGEQLAPGRVDVVGVAFNDGACPLDAVFVSIDKGQTWQRAELQRPTSLYAWSPWRLQVNKKPGPLSIWSRAIDTWGRSQPLDGSVAWNPSGYEWNGVEKVQTR
jgi:DMSO/TMAO reductase YedYZ molybdopterin-dependent catalytic subunit